MRVRDASHHTRASDRLRRSPAYLVKIAARVLAQVRSKQGQRRQEIGRALRTDTGVLKKPIAQLLAAKKPQDVGAEARNDALW